MKQYQNTQTYPSLHQPGPRTTWGSGVINVSVIQACVQGSRQGRWAAAARLWADISGHRVSDVSSLLPGGRERMVIWLGRWARRKVTAQTGVINKTRSWVSPVPLSISTATSPKCICSRRQTHADTDANINKTSNDAHTKQSFAYLLINVRGQLSIRSYLFTTAALTQPDSGNDSQRTNLRGGSLGLKCQHSLSNKHDI